MFCLSPVVSKWGGRNRSSIDSRAAVVARGAGWLIIMIWNDLCLKKWILSIFLTSPLKMKVKTQRICICHCAVLQCLRAAGKLCLICVVLTMNLVEVFCSDYSLACDRICRSRGIFFVLIPWALFTSIRLAHLSGFSQNFSFFLKKFWTLSPISE